MCEISPKTTTNIRFLKTGDFSNITESYMSDEVRLPQRGKNTRKKRAITIQLNKF